MLVIPFFVATIFTAVVMLEPDIYTIGTEKATEGGRTSIARGEVDATPPKDITSTSPRLSSLAMFGLRSQRAILALLVGFLILSVYLQVAYYPRTAPARTLQPPFSTLPPAH